VICLHFLNPFDRIRVRLPVYARVTIAAEQYEVLVLVPGFAGKIGVRPWPLPARCSNVRNLTDNHNGIEVCFFDQQVNPALRRGTAAGGTPPKDFQSALAVISGSFVACSHSGVSPVEDCPDANR
jgi:hypothetical protein